MKPLGKSSGLKGPAEPFNPIPFNRAGITMHPHNNIPRGSVQTLGQQNMQAGIAKTPSNVGEAEVANPTAPANVQDVLPQDRLKQFTGQTTGGFNG